jgi:hypothetical protein
MLQHLKVQLAEAFNGVGGQCADGHYLVIWSHLLTTVLGVWFELLVSKHFTVTDAVYCCALLGSVPKSELVHPKSVNILFQLMAEF